MYPKVKKIQIFIEYGSIMLLSCNVLTINKHFIMTGLYIFC